MLIKRVCYIIIFSIFVCSCVTSQEPEIIGNYLKAVNYRSEESINLYIDHVYLTKRILQFEQNVRLEYLQYDSILDVYFIKVVNIGSNQYSLDFLKIVDNKISHSTYIPNFKITGNQLFINDKAYRSFYNHIIILCETVDKNGYDAFYRIKCYLPADSVINVKDLIPDDLRIVTIDIQNVVYDPEPKNINLGVYDIFDFWHNKMHF